MKDAKKIQSVELFIKTNLIPHSRDSLLVLSKAEHCPFKKRIYSITRNSY